MNDHAAAGRRTRPLYLLALICAACVPPQPTPAVVARMVEAAGGRQLTACTVNLNWTEEDLRQNCGSPDQVVAWAGHEDGRCALYRTSARSFAVGMGVRVIAACMTPSKYKRPAPYMVEQIFGLDSDILP